MPILFACKADEQKVSAHSLAVIQSLMTVAGLKSVLITSVQRTAAEQARAMYDNCVRFGAEKQRLLYGKFGDEVIAVYVGSKAAKLSEVDTITAMTEKILELGPANVSHHCADPSKLNVIDISATHLDRATSPSLMTHSSRLNFHLAIKREPRIVRFFDPFTKPSDPAFHIEISQTA